MGRDSVLAMRVAARHQMRQADQPSGARQHANKLTKPVNGPKGISHEIVRENGARMLEPTEDHVQEYRRDIQPRDVFNLTPNHAGVLNLVETGNDLQSAIDHGVPRDKGYATVYNLSQYLIRTDGGNGGKAVGSK